MSGERSSAWYARPDPTGTTASGERGLRFSCTMCGNCCTGPPGYVRFTPAEGRAMASAVGVSEAEFLERFTHESRIGPSLNETKTAFGYDCVFLDRETIPGRAVCGLYEARPSQCRTWPFWPGNLVSPEAWEGATRRCPGMNRGTLHPIEVVQLTLERALADEDGP
jgi:Fe-S-cluster containining protein